MLLLSTGSFASEADTADVIYPERMKSRSTLETIAYIPGAIVHYPIHLIFTGFGGTVGWVVDTKVIERVNDLLTSDDELRGLQPTYSARTGAGANLYQKGLLSGFAAHNKDTATLTAAFGFRGRHYYQLLWESIPLPLHRTDATLTARQRLFPEEAFFGVGPHSQLGNKTIHSHRRTRISGDLARDLTNMVTVKVAAGADWNEIGDGAEANEVDDDGEIEEPSTNRTYTEAMLPGVIDPAALGYVGLGFEIDSRNRPGDPTRGVHGHLSSKLHSDLEGGHWGFVRSEIDVSYYKHLIYKRVFVFRAAVSSNRTSASGRAIPFYELAELGEDNTIRGFERNRFRGRDKAIGSIEYRFPLRDIWGESGLDFSLFVDAGQVSSRGFFNDVRWKDTLIGVGGGFRIWNLDGMVAKVELARSREMWRIYLVLN
ncbi:outer membrane protein assembly factor [bacterium]|nr:outer membrane protein assembly factor [bacterium]